MNYLAQSDVQKAFGTVAPPQGMNFGGSDPVAGFGTLVGFGVRLFIIVAAMFMLVYLFLGALEWITSSGEKEKLTKAQQKITNALIGMVLIFVVIVVFTVFAGNILKIVTPTNQGWQLNLPVLK